MPPTPPQDALPSPDLEPMMDMLPVHLWYLTDAETIGRVNECHAAYHGRSKKDLEFRKIRDVLGEEIARPCMQRNLEVIEARAPVYYEEWIPDGHGAKRLLAITKTPKFTPDGKDLEYILCFAMDITDRRKTKLQLVQDEENFRTFLESAADIIIIFSDDWRILYANPAASRKLGYTNDEILSMRIQELHPTWAIKDVEASVPDVIAGKQPHCTHPVQTKGGDVFPGEIRAWKGRWDGKDCFFGTCKDLSREKESQRNFEICFRDNPAPMSINNFEDRAFIDINRAWQQKFGYTLEEVRGRSGSEIGLFASKEQAETVPRLMAAYANIRDFEMQLVTRNGQVVHCLVSSVLVEGHGHRDVLTTILDITDRKKAETEREKTIQELKLALEQIRTLKGFLPICSCCKKIRNDRGYWEQVEAYISKHSDATFTHGICPECKKKYYPDFCKGDE